MGWYAARPADTVKKECTERTLTLVPYHAFQGHTAEGVDHGVPENRVLAGARHGVGWDEPEISKTHECRKRTSDWSRQIPKLGIYPAFPWGELLMKAT